LEVIPETEAKPEKSEVRSPTSDGGKGLGLVPPVQKRPPSPKMKTEAQLEPRALRIVTADFCKTSIPVRNSEQVQEAIRLFRKECRLQELELFIHANAYSLSKQ
jgi:hypothetical protein